MTPDETGRRRRHGAPGRAPAPGRELLIGGAKITEFVLKRKAKREDVRWLYGQLPAFAGVIWRLTEGGELLSWTDELTELLETKAAEAKAAARVAAQAKVTEKEALADAERRPRRTRRIVKGKAPTKSKGRKITA